MSLWSRKTKYSNLHLIQTFKSLFLLESWKCGPFYERENAYDTEKRPSETSQAITILHLSKEEKKLNKSILHSSDKRAVIDSLWPKAGGGVSAHSKRQPAQWKQWPDSEHKGLKTSWNTYVQSREARPEQGQRLGNCKRASTLKDRKVSKNIHLTPTSSGLMKIVPNTEIPASTRD